MKKMIIIFILFLTGCNYTELNNLSIIKTIGISYQDNNYILYAQLIDTNDKDSPTKTTIITVSDNSFTNLFSALKKQVNKKIFYSHIDLLILDFSLKDNNYKDIIKYFISNNEFRNDFQCILSNNINDVLTNTKYNEIEDLIADNPYIINTSFEKIINQYLNKKGFNLSEINYNQKILFTDNYYYYNNNYERIDYEKEN